MFNTLIDYLNTNIRAIRDHVPVEEKDIEKRNTYLQGMEATVKQIKNSEEFIKAVLAAELFEEVVKYLADELDYDFVLSVLQENIQGFEDIE